MKLNKSYIAQAGGTITLPIYYTASTEPTKLSEIQTHHANTLTISSLQTASPPLIFIAPSRRSPDSLPSDHKAWKEFDELMAKLDALEDVDDDLAEDWVDNLRGGSASRLEPYED